MGLFRTGLQIARALPRSVAVTACRLGDRNRIPGRWRQHDGIGSRALAEPRPRTGPSVFLAEAVAHEAGRGWKLGEGRILQKDIERQRDRTKIQRRVRAEVLHRA